MKKYLLLIIIFLLGLIVSGINPNDYFTWILEVFPGIIGVAVLIAMIGAMCMVIFFSSYQNKQIEKLKANPR